MVSVAQRRPGRAPRRHASFMPRKPSATSPSAQRRPGRAPRRHLVRMVEGVDAVARSTKAGACTPATPPPRGQGRAHPLRSTKAGACTPATPAGGDCDGGGPIRSTKAGACTPATPVHRPAFGVAIVLAQRRPGRAPRRHPDEEVLVRVDGCTLNEGRGVHPGDTPEHVHRRAHRGRSTKAGACTPATRAPVTRRGPEYGDVRSTKAGACTPATHPRQGHDERRGVDRSTKAGACTPATPAHGS